MTVGHLVVIRNSFSIRCEYAMGGASRSSVSNCAFLCGTLKAGSVCSMCHIAMVDSAFERAQPNVYVHVMSGW